ncbi:hypothetical protein HDU87_003378 [Geranomyces variabilis]|uniref:YCII-related domain-containing protein n=1 Tax=Geranomyces variabilis TaxID=109894 RepID=A0AAD5TKN1_9FUNG|nr:hypothetical protein HDU87_003378 [Geranomyces variabilis]
MLRAPLSFPRSFLPAHALRRCFASTSAAHEQFVIIARDGADPKAFERRMAIRPAHLAGVKKLKAAGQVVLGGAIIGDESKMVGSVMVVDMPTKEAVEQYIKSDPYVKHGVWTKWEILPFKPAALD